MSRILGVDYGSKRIGLAISDGLGLTARPLEVVSREELLERLRSLRDEYGFDRAIVGLPTGLSGKEGHSALAARALADEIGEDLQIDVVMIDERFTSRIAEEALLESGMKRRDRKETVDKVAAAIILQTYLDSRQRNGNSEPPNDVESPESQ